MRILFFIAFLLITKDCSNIEEQQPLKNVEAIEYAINDILRLSNEDKIDILNKEYINDSIGIYERKKIGIVDRFFHYKKIEKEKSSVGTMYQVMTNLDNEDTKKKVLFYDDLKYDCNNFQWNKSGLVASKFKGFKTFVKDNLTKIELEKIELIEKGTYMVVLTNADLVFYLTKVNGKYYITLIDRVITDCGA